MDGLSKKKQKKHKDILVKKQTKTKKIMQIIQICERGKWVHKIKHIYTDNEKLDPTGFVCVVFWGVFFFFGYYKRKQIHTYRSRAP